MDKQQVRWQRRLKIEVINHYGSACYCCGEKDIRLLTIDHPDDDGKEHRDRVGSGLNFYLSLRREGFPEGLRVACYNCNIGRSKNKGICPHQDPLPKDYASTFISPRRLGQRLMINGEEKNIREWAESFSIDYGVVRQRLLRGMDPLAALTKKPRNYEHLVTIGDEARSISEWARRKSIGYRTVRSRLARGMDPISALTKPVRKV